jgi:tRNA pseudouridine38-40 synthase
MHDTNEPALPHAQGGLVRVRLDLGYDGTDFAGWAQQPGQRTVQGELQRALETLFRLPSLRLVVAGRTDAGVHALAQVAHLDLDVGHWHEHSAHLVRRLGGLLPADVRVFGVRAAPSGFDARFSALWRRYRYRISDADFGVAPLRRLDTAAWRRRLDVPAMQAAAHELLGLHDYVAFCRRRAGASTVRHLQILDVARTDELVEFEVRADAFCHSMVRSLVGALTAVGDGARPSDWPAGLLRRTSRADEVTVAPARGLTLVEIGYPADRELAGRAELTRTFRGPL